MYKLSNYQTGRVEFFYPDGEPRVWYVVVDDEKIELLDKKGFHTGVGIDSLPITKSVLAKLKKAKWENLSINNIVQEQPPVKAQQVLPPPAKDSSTAVADKLPQKKEYKDRKPGIKHSGNMMAGKRTGKGTYTWPNGNRYEGDFLDGKGIGKGTYYKK